MTATAVVLPLMALGTAVGLASVTWDQVDQRPGQCGASPEAAPTYASFHARCYRSTSRRLRTAPVSPSAPVRVWPGNGPGRSVAPSALPDETSAAAANDIPAQYRVWELTMVGGTVVAIEQGNGGGA